MGDRVLLPCTQLQSCCLSLASASGAGALGPARSHLPASNPRGTWWLRRGRGSPRPLVAPKAAAPSSPGFALGVRKQTRAGGTAGMGDRFVMVSFFQVRGGAACRFTRQRGEFPGQRAQVSLVIWPLGCVGRRVFVWLIREVCGLGLLRVPPACCFLTAAADGGQGGLLIRVLSTCGRSPRHQHAGAPGPSVAGSCPPWFFRHA